MPVHEPGRNRCIDVAPSDVAPAVALDRRRRTRASRCLMVPTPGRQLDLGAVHEPDRHPDSDRPPQDVGLAPSTATAWPWPVAPAAKALVMPTSGTLWRRLGRCARLMLMLCTRESAASLSSPCRVTEMANPGVIGKRVRPRANPPGPGGGAWASPKCAAMRASCIDDTRA